MKLWSEGYKCTKKSHFLSYRKRRHDAQITWPYAYYVTLSGESLQNGQLELRGRNWYFAWETHKDTAVSVWACQAGFWKSTGTSCQLRHAVLHGVCEIALTEVLATQMGVKRRRSKKVSSFELYKLIHFRLTADRLRGSSCIVIPGVVCALLQFAATQQAGIVNFFLSFLSTTRIHSLLKNLRWQPHWLPRLTSLQGKPTENKID